MTAHRRFVINRDRDTERLARFRARNAHVTGIERVAAVDGHALDRAELVRQGYIEPDLNYGPGTLGCAMSHIRLWERAVADAAPVSIFEDDAVLCTSFDEAVANSLQSIGDDWDIVFWGTNFDPSFTWVRIGASRARIEPYGQRTDEDIERFIASPKTISLVQVLHSFGKPAYSVSSRGARRLLDRMLPIRAGYVTFPDVDVVVENDSSDIALCAIYPELRAFICLDPLAMPDPNAGSVRLTADKSRLVDNS